MRLKDVNFDCLHFRGDRPCDYNKKYGVFCNSCDYYEKDRRINYELPDLYDYEEENFTESPVRILIIKLDATGDVLRTTSVLPSLKMKYADSEIYWITRPDSFGVIKDNEFIDEIHFDQDDSTAVYNEKFHIAINLDSSYDSCNIMSKINADRKYGYTLVCGKPYPVNSSSVEWYLMGVDDNRKKRNTKTYHRIIHEISELKYSGTKPQITVTKALIRKATEINEKLGLSKYEYFFLVNLGGGNRWQLKKWTKDGYSELVNRLSEDKNHAVGLIAGADEINFYDEVCSQVIKRDNVLQLGTGNTTEEFIAIVYLSDRVFTSDSLCFHIAVAFGKYTVCFTGPTSHTELDVFGNGAVIYSDKVDCLCCYLNRCDKVINCMNTLTVEEVYQAFTHGLQE